MSLAERFKNVRVIVVGDLMLDRFWWGNASRISPEAPVPVVRLERETLKPGGAANVAANIAGLNATPILIGMTGKDEAAKVFIKILAEEQIRTDGIVASDERKTTVKTRIVAHGQQVARVDQESDHHCSENERTLILAKVREQLDGANALIISDYAKGLFTRELLSEIIAVCREKQVYVLVDPKGKDYTKYNGASLLTPNKKETIEAAGVESNIQNAELLAGRDLIERLDVENLLVTRGEDGMALFGKIDEPINMESQAREVYDVTGAGDTVIATLGVAIAAGFDLPEAAELANRAAGIVVGQIGTTAISVGDLESGELIA